MADDKTRLRQQVVKTFEYSPRLSVVQTFFKGDDTSGMTKAAIEHGVSVGAIADVPASAAKE